MSIISRSQLKGFQRYSKFSELRNSQSAAQRDRKRPVFLSHSHLDESLVLNAVSFIEGFGGEVYVDWLDPGLPEETDAQTEMLLREKMHSASRFILLASPRALSSRWVPWELGYADASKGMKQVAILPVREDNEGFPGNEYLRIYPTIDMTDGKPFVKFPGQEQGTSLGYWLGPHWGKVLYGPPMPIHLED